MDGRGRRASRTRESSTVLDLGCGTGRFSEGLATRSNANVVGVDPSRTMLAEAVEAPDSLPSLLCLRFRGSSATEGLTPSMLSLFRWSSTTSRIRMLSPDECRRVLRDLDACSCERLAAKRFPCIPMSLTFPATIPLLEQRLPSLRFQREVFEAASFAVLFSRRGDAGVAPDYSDLCGQARDESRLDPRQPRGPGVRCGNCAGYVRRGSRAR